MFYFKIEKLCGLAVGVSMYLSKTMECGHRGFFIETNAFLWQIHLGFELE